MKIKTTIGEVRVELPNGRNVNFETWFGRVLRTQDMRHWQREPEAFDEWAKTTFKGMINGCRFVLPRLTPREMGIHGSPATDAEMAEENRRLR